MMRYLWTGLCLTALIAVVYLQTGRFEFLGFDDPQLVTENSHVRRGVTMESVKWAFFSSWRENVFYYPLSLVSHMADVSGFGLDSGRHHLTNVAVHAAAVLALFALLARLSGGIWRAGLAAGLFAVHPLGVDSVAWVTERSNLLCALLTVAAMGAYAQYRTSRRKRWYGFSLGLFFLALLAKPTAVMAPVVMWLIGRLDFDSGPVAGAPRLPVVRDLLPFAVLAALRIMAVLAAERGASPAVSDGVMTTGMLAANALTAMTAYLIKAVFPFRLSVYYPFPQTLPLWQPLVSGLVMTLVTAMILKAGRRRPMVLLGWVWFLAFLAPSFGAVRSGPWPAMADHYVYIPLMGLFTALVWLAPAPGGSRRRRTAAGAIACSLVAYFAAVSYVHAGHYRNSVTLFTRALELDSKNFLARIGLGNAFRRQGAMAAAEEHFRAAVAIRPESPGAHNNLGLVLAERGGWKEAEQHFLMALALDPGFAMARDNLINLERKRAAAPDAGGDSPGRAASEPPREE
ncbi:MAG: tetratricopeptide repeat protein [Thermodesulfobacteriota bacterium]